MFHNMLKDVKYVVEVDQPLANKSTVATLEINLSHCL